jgi:hypothetical protein
MSKGYKFGQIVGIVIGVIAGSIIVNTAINAFRPKPQIQFVEIQPQLMNQPYQPQQARSVFLACQSHHDLHINLNLLTHLIHLLFLYSIAFIKSSYLILINVCIINYCFFSFFSMDLLFIYHPDEVLILLFFFRMFIF